MEVRMWAEICDAWQLSDSNTSIMILITYIEE